MKISDTKKTSLNLSKYYFSNFKILCEALGISPSQGINNLMKEKTIKHTKEIEDLKQLKKRIKDK